MGPGMRKVVSVSRILHLVCSMLAVGMFALFAISGVTLTQKETFGLDGVEGQTATATIPTEMARRGEQGEIVAHLLDKHGLGGAVDSFEIEEDMLYVVLVRPGERSDVSIDRESGEMEIMMEKGGLLAVLADLHKGENAGKAWAWMLLSAGVCLLIAGITGIILWLATPKRRKLGLIALVIGLVAFIGAYLALVP